MVLVVLMYKSIAVCHITAFPRQNRVSNAFKFSIFVVTMASFMILI